MDAGSAIHPGDDDRAFRSPHLGAHEALDLSARVGAAPGRRLMLAHALRCPRCRWLLEEFLPPAPRVESALDGPGAPLTTIASLVADLAQASPQLAVDRLAAEGFAAEVLATPPCERLARVASEPSFHTVSGAIVLLRNAVAAEPEAPAEAESLAQVALFLLAWLRPAGALRFLVGELEAGAWALIARAGLRRMNWPGVRQALAAADQALVESGYAPRRPAYKRLLAAVRLAERRWRAMWPIDRGSLELLLRALDEALPGGEGVDQ